MKSSKPTIRAGEALYKAKALFKRHRWIQGDALAETPTKGYCLLGALDKAEDYNYFAIGKVKGAAFLASAVKELYPERYRARYGCFEFKVVDFNDHEDTARKDALKVLDRAVELAEDQLNR